MGQLPRTNFLRYNMVLMPFIFSDRFKQNLTRFRDYKAIVQRLKENTGRSGTELDIIQFYLDTVWPNRRTGTALVKKIAKKEKEYFEFRPVITDLSQDYLLVDSRVLAIQVIITRGQSLQIIGASLVPNSDPQDFEAEVTGEVIWESKKKLDGQDVQFLRTLEAVQGRAPDPINRWQAFLDWQESQIVKNQRVFDFQNAQLNDRGELVLEVMTSRPLPRYLCQAILGSEFAVLPRSASTHKHHWSPPDDLGRLDTAGVLTRFNPRSASKGRSKKGRKSQPGQYRAVLDLEDEFLQTIADRPKKLPTEGFLVSSIAGDIAPLRNQMRALERFSAGKFYCPTLADWLFDGTQAKVSKQRPPKLGKTLQTLNAKQKVAVQKALVTPEVFLLQGPPGTGKTTVIAELAYQVTLNGGNVLISSQTNLAVDNALDRLVNVPHMRPLRIGASHRVTSQGQPFLLRRATKRWLEAVKQHCREERRKSKDTVWDTILSQWLERLSRPTDADLAEFEEVYRKQANVLGMTCNEAGKIQFWGSAFFKPFDLVIVDEVSKATLPELLMPMLLGKRIILVGDHRQLPPLFREVTFQEAVEEGELGEKEDFQEFDELVTTSLYVKLFGEVAQPLRETLMVQYRMHPHIMQAVNHFYADSPLTCGLSEPNEQRRHGLTIARVPTDQHLLWVDSSFREGTNPAFETQAGTSKVNSLEVELVLRVLEELDRGLANQGFTAEEPKEVGVISFYGAQLLEMRGRIRSLQNKGHFQTMKVRTNTVDRFQGMERPIIILSMVRAKKGRVGDFVKRYQRINVAMSRAQELLVVVGSAQTFGRFRVEVMSPKGEPVQEPVYRRIIRQAEKREALVPAKAFGL